MDFTCLVWLQCPTAQKECDNIQSIDSHRVSTVFFVITDCKMEKQKSVNLKLTYT